MWCQVSDHGRCVSEHARHASTLSDQSDHEGYKRKLGVKGQWKLRIPISVVTLHQIRSFINSSNANKLDRRMFWAVPALAFFLFFFLHSSEYTAASVKLYLHKSTPQHCDITIERAKMIVLFKPSKTDSFKEGISLSIACTGSSMCPARAIKKIPSGSS